MIDLRKEVRESEDWEELQEIVSSMVGETLLNVRMSYGDELALHFGQPVPAIMSTRGEWVLRLRDCVCDFEGDLYNRLSDSQPVTVTGVTLLRTEGEMIFNMSLGNGVTLRFTNTIVEDLQRADDDFDPLANWELFTPYGTYLRVGPGFVWSLLPADSPGNPSR